MSVATSFKWDGNAVKWRGKPSFQLPSDLIRYQEIICERRPDWIIETGPGEGGTTEFLRDVCDNIHHGIVFATENSLKHIEYVSGLVTGGSVMVILDSDVYSRAHMQMELANYAPLVTPGQFLIICHTDRPDWGALPAMREFMRENTAFEMRLAPDPSMSTYLERLGG